MRLKVMLQPGEDRGFVAHVPALRGCWTQGATREEALANVREAIEGWLEAEQDKAEGDASRSGEIELVTV
jgi:predicted RNase H-like HicB family nuclease